MHLLVDIGGTKTRIGISEDLKDIDAHKIIATPKDFEGGVDAIMQTAVNLSKGRPFKSCAVGIREILDKEREKLINDPATSFFPDWIQKPLKSTLVHDLGCSVYLENDASMAALGEATWGSGHGFNIVAFITVSTGLGGSRIVNGKIDSSSLGFEPGEQVINYLGETVHLGDIASGIDIHKKYGQKPEEIDDLNVWNKVGKALSIGLYNITVLWSPDVIVLGGGLMKKISIEDLQNQMIELNRKLPSLPEIKATKLGDLSGLYGALEYLKQQ